MENMLSGKCDENWAKQNHNLWYAKIQGQTSRKPLRLRSPKRSRTKESLGLKQC